MLGAERQRWVITLCGVLGDHPPTDLAEWRAFARSLATPDIDALVKDREPLTPVASYRFAATQRRLYSRLPRFPAGLLMVGDCRAQLQSGLRPGDVRRALPGEGARRVPRRRRRELAGARLVPHRCATEAPWAITTGEDSGHPAVGGKRPPGLGVINRYMERAHHAATRIPVVLRRFFDVANLLVPPTAMRSPAIAWRVLLGGRGVSQESPAQKLGAAAAPA